MNRLIVLLVLLIGSLVKAQTTEIQYLANEGVLIKSGDHKILIDAIFTKEFDYLDVLTDSELEKFKAVMSPYKDINLILATHVHGDHFKAKHIGEYLLKNKETLFLGPQEVIINFKENFSDYQKISNQIKSETPGLFNRNTIKIKEITIDVLRIEHFGDKPWNEAENVAYVIHINNKKILHLGDGKIDVKNLKELNLKNIDVAILPYWQLGSIEQRGIIKKHINPKQILVAHIPLNSYSSAQTNINALNYKNTIALTKLFQTIVLN